MQYILSEEEYDKVKELEEDMHGLTEGIDKIIKEIEDEIIKREKSTGEHQLGKKGCLQKIIELRSEFEMY